MHLADIIRYITKIAKEEKKNCLGDGCPRINLVNVGMKNTQKGLRLVGRSKRKIMNFKEYSQYEFYH